MTILCVTWETAHLFGESWISHHRLRHRMFVERQGWEIPSYRGMEYDQFDTPASVYILWCDSAQQARGMTRLIPTERPYMIRELWPELMGGEALPAAPDIWEATRFGVDRDLEPKVRRRVVGELIAGCLEYGIRHRISQYLCFMPVPILRGVLMRSGCSLDLIGKPVGMGGIDSAVARITISPGVLAEVRRRRDIHEPVLHAEGGIGAEAA